MQLAEFLRRERAQIIAQWVVSSAPSRSRQVDHATLVDHLPDFLEAIAQLMESGERPDFGKQNGDFDRQSGIHALVRLEAGYNLEEVIREYATLRTVILERWRQLSPGGSNVLLNRAIDDAIAASVSWFSWSRQRTLAALDRISEVAFEIEDLDELLLSLLRVVVEATESVNAAAIFLRDGDLLRLRTTVGLERDAELGLTMKIGEGFGGRVAARRMPLELRQAANDPMVRSAAIHESGIRALYGLPLMHKGEVIGVAELGSRIAWEFAESDKLLFRTMVERATAAIATQRLKDAVLAEGRRVRLVTELLPVGVFEIDSEGRIVLVNPGARAIWGDAVEERLGSAQHDEFKAWRVSNGQRVRASDWAVSKALRDGETTRNEELEIVSFDGIRRTILASAAPLHDREKHGRITGAVEVHADITEMRRRESELRFLAEVSTALSQTLDLDLTLDRIARVAVPWLADWCGIDLLDRRSDRQEPTVRRVALTHADPRLERVSTEMAAKWPPGLSVVGSNRVIATGKPLLVSDVNDSFLEGLAQSAEHLDMLRRLNLRSYMCVPMIMRDTIVGAIALSTGPSKRRFEERDLRVAQELAWRASLAFENARLYAESQEAIRTRDELWDIAAHELRNPLTAVHLQIATALRQARRTPDDIERLTSKLLAADRQVERLIALTNELLDTTRARSGRLEVRQEFMDLSRLVREVVEAQRNQTDAIGVTLHCDVEDDVYGHWDPVRLEQVVTNLLSNAIKYGRRKPIRVRLAKEGNIARLSVADEGIGIEPKDQHRIFQPFERTGGTREVSGMGLGLYVSRIIVEAHHGRLQVKSTPGVGSVFTMELPLEPLPNGAD